MSTKMVEPRPGKLSTAEQVELTTIASRVKEGLRRTAADLLAIGADLNRAKMLVGHGNFGPWLDREFGLSRRSAEQFMAAARRFGTRSEVVSHLPAGTLLELSAPSVPDELVDRVVAGELPASVSAIRAERISDRTYDRVYEVAGSFLDRIEQLRPKGGDLAAAIAAQVIRAWEERGHRQWFADALRKTAELVESSLDMRVPLVELPRTTVRKLKSSRAIEN